MSQMVSVTGLKIADPALIEKAVTFLQKEGIECDLLKNAKPRTYFSYHAEECEFVLNLKNSRFDVGMKWNPKTKEYDLCMDTHGDYIKNQIGIQQKGEDYQRAHVHKFVALYEAAGAIDYATMMGHTVDIDGLTWLPDGNLKMEAIVAA